MDVDRMQKGSFLNLESAVPISSKSARKLENILATESTLIAVEKDKDCSCTAKLHLLANPVEHYTEICKIIGGAYKLSNELAKYRTYKESIPILNSVNIIESTGSFCIDLQYRSVKGFMEILNNPKSV